MALHLFKINLTVKTVKLSTFTVGKKTKLIFYFFYIFVLTSTPSTLSCNKISFTLISSTEIDMLKDICFEKESITHTQTKGVVVNFNFDKGQFGQQRFQITIYKPN